MLDRVLRRPLVSAVASAGVLVALAVPALSMNPAQSGLDAMPASLEEMQSYNRINDAFPGGALPAVVAIAGDASDPELQAAVAELRKQALASGQALEPIDVVVAPGGKAMQVEIPLVGKGTDARVDGRSGDASRGRHPRDARAGSAASSTPSPATRRRRRTGTTR